nr:hypothetical protein [uncultured Acetatifactor sp.]
MDIPAEKGNKILYIRSAHIIKPIAFGILWPSAKIADILGRPAGTILNKALKEKEEDVKLIENLYGPACFFRAAEHRRMYGELD